MSTLASTETRLFRPLLRFEAVRVHRDYIGVTTTLWRNLEDDA